jgi:hypothetical protein
VAAIGSAGQSRQSIPLNNLFELLECNLAPDRKGDLQFEASKSRFLRINSDINDLELQSLAERLKETTDHSKVLTWIPCNPGSKLNCDFFLIELPHNSSGSMQQELVMPT